jgi:hypothetical protein
LDKITGLECSVGSTKAKGAVARPSIFIDVQLLLLSLWERAV